MIRAQILTRWVQSTVNGHIENWPAIFTDVVPQSGDSWVDATAHPSANIPPQPNVLVIEVNVDPATMAAIKAHAQYGNAAVLWEGDPDNSPVVTTGQYNALVTFLAKKFGASEAAVRGLLGATAAGRTRVAIANQIITYLRSRPHQ